MIVVADATPLIFLSKINQLVLIPMFCDGEILVPSKVRHEILGRGIPPDEERLLAAFLSKCKVVDVKKPDLFAKALSFADNCVLTLACNAKTDIIVADDRLLRKVAIMEGIHVIGTLGILIWATQKQLLSSKKAHNLLNDLVEEHSFRISTAVYEVALSAILGDQSG